MNVVNAILREARFMARDRTLVLTMIILLALSALSVGLGLAEVRQQQNTIDRLIEIDRQERTAVLSQQTDFGGAAYYSFHLTYDRPSDFAFATLGQRDNQPWKHRLRMLALEGQIYERDVGNPLFALIGRFDFAFLAAFIYPLFLILMLHDLQARERMAGRHDLLVATVGRATSFWALRASVRSALAMAALITPFIVVAIASGATLPTLAAGLGAVFLYTALWALLCYWIGSWKQSTGTIMATLMGIWILLAVIIPTTGREVIDRMIPVPTGASIAMTQREAVNDAWDLPKEQTMAAFLARHPEWQDQAEITRPFEWKWYYAFQQVGDQTAESLSTAYRDGRLQRDQMAARVALLAPPAMLQRVLQSLAETDVSAALDYENRVRAFHTQLRHFFYPLLFTDHAFDADRLTALPQFEDSHPRNRSNKLM